MVFLEQYVVHKKIGFYLENIVYQEQAVSSGTQGLNKKNTFRGDFVYNFIKTNTLKNSSTIINAPSTYLIKEIKKIIKKKNNFITPDKLYEKIIPMIVNKNIYKDENNKSIDVELILNKNFKYKQIKKDNNFIYGWTL